MIQSGIRSASLAAASAAYSAKRAAVSRASQPPCVLERLRQVPVVQRGHRGDAAGQQRIGQPLVEVQAGRVGRAPAGGLDARPGEGEPVAADAEPGHQLDVLAPPVVVVVGHVGGLVVADGAGLAAEHIPDRLAAAVLGRGALDLERRGGHPPGEAAGEPRQGCAVHSAPSAMAASTSARRAASSASYLRRSTSSAISLVVAHQRFQVGLGGVEDAQVGEGALDTFGPTARCPSRTARSG